MTQMKLLQNDGKDFERIKKVEKGVEYWYGRDLMIVLDYSLWQNFRKVIDKAMVACKNSGLIMENHFIGVNKMVEISSNSHRKVYDLKLTRYACYLIAQKPCFQFDAVYVISSPNFL